MRTLVAAAVVFLAALPSPAQAPPKADGRAVSVPFTLLPSRHMLVEARVNGNGPYKLIFDTGAPITLLSTRLARDAGLIKKNARSGFSIFGGLNQIDVAKFQLGGATAEKAPAVVMDHPTVQAISEAFRSEVGTIDGIVGFPFFARFATTVDYQKKELTLKPTDYKPGDYLKDLSENLMAMGEKAGQPRVVGSAGLWGFAVDKPDGDDGGGVVVGQVYAGGPAAAAGLKIGDRVLTIDGRWADTVADAYLAASLVRPGRAADVSVKRGGRDVTLTVTPTKGF